MAVTTFLADHIPYALALALLGLYLAQLVIANLSSNKVQEKQWADVESKLETIGASRGPFRWTRRFTSAVFSMPGNATAGYNKFCKALNRPFVLPTTWTGRAIVVAPPSMLHKVMTRPDKSPSTGSDITHIMGLVEAIQLPYIIADPDIYMNALHFDVVRRQMTKKNMPFFAAMTAEEIDAAFGDIWGTSGEWTTINGWDTCGRIIARTAERMMLGLPHGRDERLLEASRLYANSVLLGGAVINCFPPFLRRAAGPLIALRAKYYQKRCVGMLIPIIEERMAIYRGEKTVKEVPEDFVQWLIATCDNDGPHQMFADRIANRLIALMTPLIFAVCYVFAHTVLDVYGSPDRQEFIQGLVAEAKRVSSVHNGLSTAEAVDELYRFDSAIRESMRKSDVSVTSLHRDVTSGEMDLGDGIIIREGIRVGFPSQNIHMDPDNYHEPGRYDAFRFSRAFEGTGEASRKKGEAPERELITTPTQSFLPLGYGRHACPGRWFAANTMKQALAFIVMNYDVELVGKPIKRWSLLNTMVPPVDAQIRIRRKS